MRVIAHSGGGGLGPRNTIATIRKALEYHVDEVEFDVRVTQDKVPILCHDPWLISPAGSRLGIHDHSFGELKHHNSSLATLTEALNTIDNKSVAYVEVKPREAVEPIVEVLKKYLPKDNHKSSNILLASRSGHTLRQLHSALPEVPTAVIEFWSGIRAARNARSVGTRRLHMLEYWVWSGYIRGMTKRGYQVYSFNSVYPAKARIMSWFGRSGQTNDPERIKPWQKAGLVGVITDYPDRFRS